MGAAVLDHIRVAGERAGRNSIPGKNFVQIQPVDRAQAVKPVHGWHGTLVLNVGQTAEGDDEFIILVAGGNARAGLLHVAKLETQPLAYSLEFLSGFLHDRGSGQRVQRIGRTHDSHGAPRDTTLLLYYSGRLANRQGFARESCSEFRTKISTGV